MTASASVVEALRGVLEWDKARGYRLPYRVRDPIYSALDEIETITPQTAEQDAREAVDLSSLIAARCVALPGKLIDCPVCLAVDNERDRQAAPDGWVLVPVEPTEAMLGAGADAVGWNPAPHFKAAGIYRAMLSASPAPPAQGAGG